VLVAGSQAWLIVVNKLALTRRWFPQAAAEYLSEGLRAVGVSPGLPLIPFVPRRPAPWALFDLIAIGFIWIIGSLAGSVALRQLGWLKVIEDVADLPLSEQATLIAANSIISLLIVGIGVPLIASRTGARAADFGWSPSHVLTDLRLGLIGFVMLAPPVYVLQALLVLFWQPSKHPLVEMFQASPDPKFFVLLFISAAVVAPLFEEMLFRVLLQGFLEKVVHFRGEVHELFFGSVRRLQMPSPDGALEPARALGDQSSNPYATPQALPSADSSMAAALDPDAEQPTLRGLAAWLPIGASSIVFALMHYSHGPDWIPLTFLAGGMGYLYQRTHRLLPSLVVHTLVNSSSMLALWVQVYEGKG
jgi:membrane protease YdiL (CAAX protease family)